MGLIIDGEKVSLELRNESFYIVDMKTGKSIELPLPDALQELKSLIEEMEYKIAMEKQMG